jgi:uncharacterized protein (TIGR01777 family)
MKILLTGVTGLIGKDLAISLMKQGHEVSGLARKPASVSFLPANEVAAWDVGKVKLDPKFIEGKDAVIHLAGVPVAEGRWTSERKKEIRDSRVLGTREWAEILAAMPAGLRPKVFLSASAIGIYGDRGDEVLNENSVRGPGFLADVTAEWEAEAQAIERLGIRVVLLRTGVVLSRKGGALDQMQPVVLGSGKAWMSWIHLNDEVGLIEFALTHESVTGSMNLTAPHPVTNKVFTHALAKAIHVPIVLSTPEFPVKAAFGEMSAVVLGSQHILPQKALDLGYQFQYPSVESALSEIYKDRPPIETYFESAQFVPQSIPTIFNFFSRPENLGTLTPAFLDFKILKQNTPEIVKGSLIDYQIKIHGIPMHWRTLIKEWNDQKSFVDTQLKGPYSKWNHQHLFHEVSGGTLILDQITYKVPVSIVGKLLLGKFIRHDVDKIFSYRREKIAELFGSEKTS